MARRAVRAVGSSASRFYLSLASSLLLWVLGPVLLFGWQPLSITSGSMMPGIRPGDVVLGAPYDGTELEPGRVVTFEDPARPGRIVTHRIAEALPDGTYRTKGDANETADSTPVAPGAIRHVGRLLVPAVSLPLLWLGDRSLMFAAWILATLLALVASRHGADKHPSHDVQSPAADARRGGAQSATDVPHPDVPASPAAPTTFEPARARTFVPAAAPTLAPARSHTAASATTRGPRPVPTHLAEVVPSHRGPAARAPVAYHRRPSRPARDRSAVALQGSRHPVAARTARPSESWHARRPPGAAAPAPRRRTRSGARASRPATAKLIVVRATVPIVMVLALSFAGVVVAAFTGSTANASNSWSAETVAAPTSVGATAGCSATDPVVSVGWTASASATADGYRVLRAPASGGPYAQVGIAEGGAATSYSDTSVELSTTYHYVVVTTAGTWASGDSNEATATTPASCA